MNCFQDLYTLRILQFPTGSYITLGQLFIVYLFFLGGWGVGGGGNAPPYRYITTAVV